MIRPQRSSFPAPSEPNLRRLGVGANSGSDRPLRAQLVVALVSLLVLVAVPLYLWRRPGTADAVASASVSAASAAPPSPIILASGATVDPVKLGPPQLVRCSASPRAKGQEGPLCDRLPWFEDALKKAIRESLDCAPRVKTEGTVNYVLEIDFNARRIHVFPGASGQWKGKQARRAAKCVLERVAAPPWNSIRRQYGFYRIAVLAAYPAPGALAAAASAGSVAPLFE